VTIILPPDAFALMASLVAERLASDAIAPVRVATGKHDIDGRIIALLADLPLPYAVVERIAKIAAEVAFGVALASKADFS
jgi:hypothetical protein